MAEGKERKKQCCGDKSSLETKQSVPVNWCMRISVNVLPEKLNWICGKHKIQGSPSAYLQLFIKETFLTE